MADDFHDSVCNTPSLYDCPIRILNALLKAHGPIRQNYATDTYRYVKFCLKCDSVSYYFPEFLRVYVCRKLPSEF